MPQPVAPRQVSLWGWLTLAGMVAIFTWLLVTNAGARWTAGGLAIVVILGSMAARRHYKRLVEERMEESICTFARSLPAREHDTWVVRAVYEELSRLVRVPLRPTDDLKKDLRIDPDDLAEVALEIARRAGRSMDETQKNPWFDRVVTVPDLVAFFENQKKVAGQLPVPTAASGRGLS